MELFNPEVLASDGLIPGIEPLCPPAGVILRCPQNKIINFGVHGAVGSASWIIQWASDSENSPPQRPMGFDPQETVT
jgi:hypothetical protein